MAVPLMVRLEDELHAKLAEHSRRTHAPMNRIVNDALRLMFSGAIGENYDPSSSSPHLIGTFRERIQQAQAALKALDVPQENLGDLQRTTAEAIRHIFSCTQAAMIAIDPSLAPVASSAHEPSQNVSSKQGVRA